MDVAESCEKATYGSYVRLLERDFLVPLAV